MIKLKIHSVVDIITNSSTTIYTYQNGSIKPAKELINEMLKIADINKKAEDIFYFGVFLDNGDRYLELEDLPEGCPEPDNTKEIYEEKYAAQNKWLADLQLLIMKEEVEKPKWMKDCEVADGDSWDPDTVLYLIPKEDKYKEFGRKIKDLLNSVTADGGGDG